LSINIAGQALHRAQYRERWIRQALTVFCSTAVYRDEISPILDNFLSHDFANVAAHILDRRFISSVWIVQVTGEFAIVASAW
jgi:hypothetical protein